jgi:hypothetical protein
VPATSSGMGPLAGFGAVMNTYDCILESQAASCRCGEARSEVRDNTRLLFGIR